MGRTEKLFICLQPSASQTLHLSEVTSSRSAWAMAASTVVMLLPVRESTTDRERQLLVSSVTLRQPRRRHLFSWRTPTSVSRSHWSPKPTGSRLPMASLRVTTHSCASWWIPSERKSAAAGTAWTTCCLIPIVDLVCNRVYCVEDYV